MTDRFTRMLKNPRCIRKFIVNFILKSLLLDKNFQYVQWLLVVILKAHKVEFSENFFTREALSNRTFKDAIELSVFNLEQYCRMSGVYQHSISWKTDCTKLFNRKIPASRAHNNPLHHICNELDDRVLFAVKAPSDQTTTVYVDGQKNCEMLFIYPILLF